MDLTVERNAYGRQIDSRIASLELEGEPSGGGVHSRSDHPADRRHSTGAVLRIKAIRCS